MDSKGWTPDLGDKIGLAGGPAGGWTLDKKSWRGGWTPDFGEIENLAGGRRGGVDFVQKVGGGLDFIFDNSVQTVFVIPPLVGGGFKNRGTPPGSQKFTS